jgi:hypothetical protein
MKILPAGVDGGTDRQTYSTKVIVDFRDFGKRAKKMKVFGPAVRPATFLLDLRYRGIEGLYCGYLRHETL